MEQGGVFYFRLRLTANPILTSLLCKGKGLDHSSYLPLLHCAVLSNSSHAVLLMCVSGRHAKIWREDLLAVNPNPILTLIKTSVGTSVTQP